MKSKRSIIVILFAAILTGCGGGGGAAPAATPDVPASSANPVSSGSTSSSSSGSSASSSGSSSPASSGTVASSNSTSSTATPTPPATTKELVASGAFAFTSSYEVPVRIDLPSLARDDAFVTICRNYDATGDSINIDFGSCVLKASLDAGQYEGVLALTNDISRLVIAVWLYDGGDPLTWVWSQATSDRIAIGE